MASNEYGQHIRHGVEADDFDGAGENASAAPSGDLRVLLNAIVEQISEADRRHTETLQQMQNRISGIEREAQAIKPRVPGQFAAAFERIEAGMTELASRMADVSDEPSPVGASQNHVEQAVPASHGPASVAVQHTMTSQPQGVYHSQHAVYSEPPVALRSATDGATAAVSRVHDGIDPFDVIESSGSSSSDEPWDHDTAEALTGHYEAAETAYSTNSFSSIVPAGAVPLMDGHSAGVPHAWLEARFSEVAKRIEDSLGELNPDQNFFALGQRVDQLEQHFSTLFEGVATRGDVEGVRIIEAHVNQLADNLDHAQSQLQRLDVIETQLAAIAEQLGAQPADVDLESVARTAAEVAAQEFSRYRPQDNAGGDLAELGSMLRMFIADSRQGEENTTALIDTLQQAMIRLLDRVDAMELANLKSMQAQTHSLMHAQPSFASGTVASADAFAEEERTFTSHPRYASQSSVSEPAAVLADDMDAGIAALSAVRSDLAAQKVTSAPLAEEPIAVESATVLPRSPDRIRQDFITEARRAKMRLNAEGVSASEAPVVAAEPERTNRLDVRNVGKAGAQQAKKKQQSVGTAQRIKVLSLSAMLALGGIWLAKESGIFSGSEHIATTPAEADAVGTSVGTAATTDGGSSDAANGTMVPSVGTTPPSTVTDELKLPDGTRGEIVNDSVLVGSAEGPLHGVTVDTATPMTAEGLARARRQQAMATMSGKLGEAAQRSSADAPKPAALDLNALSEANPMDEAARSSIAKSSVGQSAALDLPPATVGPLSLRLAAANGDPSAEFEVGARLAEGKGTEQTFKDAAKWYQRSASKGFAQAQYRLGTLYERGLGLKADVARAKEWYTRSAEQGNVKAMHNLAVLSANQANATPDYVTAAEWFQKAADFGLADSQFNLAVLKENGLGVEADLVSAYKWLSISAKGGDKEAARRRDILKGKLTTPQLAEADAAISKWQPKRLDPQINDARKAGEAWKKNPENGVNG